MGFTKGGLNRVQLEHGTHKSSHSPLQFALRNAYLQLVLNTSSFGLFLLRILSPVRARSKYNILSNRRGVARGTSSVLLRETKLRPSLALCDSRVDHLLMYSESNSTGCLDLLAIIVESPTDNRLGSVFICGGR